MADGVVARHGVGELVELGSGASRKTAALLDAMRDAGALERYVPFDVCPEAILAAAGRLVEDYPGLEVHGVAGDFGRHLPAVPERAAPPAWSRSWAGRSATSSRPSGRRSSRRSPR